MEINLTVLLNLKCEKIQEIGTPIMARTDGKSKNLNLPKGVGFNSLSIHVKVTINYLRL